MSGPKTQRTASATVADAVAFERVEVPARRTEHVAALDAGLTFDAPAAPPERTWLGWAVVPDGNGWRRARLVLPESVVQQHALEIFAPDMRAIVAARIEQDLVSDRLVDRYGWERKR